MLNKVTGELMKLWVKPECLQPDWPDELVFRAFTHRLGHQESATARVKAGQEVTAVPLIQKTYVNEFGMYPSMRVYELSKSDLVSGDGKQPDDKSATNKNVAVLLYVNVMAFNRAGVNGFLHGFDVVADSSLRNYRACWVPEELITKDPRYRGLRHVLIRQPEAKCYRFRKDSIVISMSAGTRKFKIEKTQSIKF